MLSRAVNLYFITKYKNISTRKPKYCRAAMRIKEFILYGLRVVGSENLLLQTSHSTGFSPVCVRLWVAKLPDRENLLLQTSQSKVLFPVCVLLCLA